MNFLTTPVLYGLGALAIGAGLLAGVQTVRLSNERAAHAETKLGHARVLREIADKAAEAARLAAIARSEYELKNAEDLSAHDQELTNAFNRGKAHGAGIDSGAIRVRTVWRDRECPKTVPGQGAESAAGAEALAPGRGEAIGAVLGLGGSFDADYDLAIKRLKSAQGIVNTCYEEPANPNP